MLNHSSQNQNKNQTFSEETLRSIYAAQWQDLHHSREQDWRLFNLLVIGLIGVGGLKVINQFPELQRVSSIVFAFISLVAIGITARHSALFKEKMEAIIKIEKLLGAPDLFQKHKGWRKLFKVQYLLISIYFLFAIFFLYLACTGWDAYPKAVMG